MSDDIEKGGSSDIVGGLISEEFSLSQATVTSMQDLWFKYVRELLFEYTKTRFSNEQIILHEEEFIELQKKIWHNTEDLRSKIPHRLFEEIYRRIEINVDDLQRRMADDNHRGAGPRLEDFQKGSRLQSTAIEPSTTSELGNQPMSDRRDTYSRNEIDAKLETAHARVETQVAELRGDMRTGFAEINAGVKALTERVGQLSSEGRTSRLAIIGTVVASAVGVAAIIVGVAGVLYSGAMADRGNILSALQTGAALHGEAAPAQQGKK